MYCETCDDKRDAKEVSYGSVARWRWFLHKTKDATLTALSWVVVRTLCFYSLHSGMCDEAFPRSLDAAAQEIHVWPSLLDECQGQLPCGCPLHSTYSKCTQTIFMHCASFFLVFILKQLFSPRANTIRCMSFMLLWTMLETWGMDTTVQESRMKKAGASSMIDQLHR